ncbi:MAG TPA: hypothetical protein PK816_00560 [Candidatus Cloacimonadota bacterium]|nr:hypothetical protein [Candidatus Cloacimonadota bacterium]
MKLILLICITILSPLLYAELLVQSSFLNFNHYNTLVTSLSYTNEFDNNYFLDYRADFENSANNYFERSNKKSALKWSLFKDNHYIPLYLDYSYLYSENQGLPEDTISVIDRQTQTVSLRIDKKFWHIFSFKQLIAASKINSVNNKYSGNLYESIFSMRYTNDKWRIDNSFQYYLNHVFLDKKKNHLSKLYVSYQKDKKYIEIDLSLNHTSQDLYNYQVISDYTNRMDYNDHIKFQIPLMNQFNWSFLHTGNFRKNAYNVNKQKNNWSFDQLIDSSLNHQNSMYSLNIGVKNGLKKRYLKIENQDRKSIDRSLYSNIQFNQNMVDSLSLDLSVLLTQNFHSSPYQILDNDRQIQIGTLILQEQINRNIGIKNLFSYQRNHEVFIDKTLSSNNNRKSTYIFQPELVTQITNKLQFYNKFQLRATYENYIWNDFLSDRFYRKLTSEYGLNVINLNRNKNSRLQVSYSYETNETADKKAGLWYRNNQNIIRIYAARFRMIHQSLDYRIEPQIKYHYQSYEADILFDANWHFAKDSSLRISVNPIGKTFNQFIWKASINFEYSYF